MEWTDEVGHGDWIRERLDAGLRSSMHGVVPRGFAAYARLFPLLILAILIAMGVSVVRGITAGNDARYRLDRFARANGMTFIPTIDASGSSQSAHTWLYLLTLSGRARARRTEAELTCNVLAIVSHVAGGV